MATFPVKYVHSNMRGAPIISGTEGALISAIRAFLITGFGQVTALGVTVVSGIATASLQAGQSFALHCVVLVEGATPAELNGEARVLTASGSSITWATTAADGSATGSIKIKVAPVGQWEELFAGTVTNKAVFRSTDVQGLRFYYAIDDTGTTISRVRGFEHMTDAVTGAGPFPTDAHISGGGYLFKSSVVGSAAAQWDFFADSRALEIAIAAGSSSNVTQTNAPARGFGDMIPLRGSGDAFAAAVSCVESSNSAVFAYAQGAFSDNSFGAVGSVYLPRTKEGVGSATKAQTGVYVGTTNTVSGADDTLGAFPSSVDGELKYSRRFIRDTDNKTPRAEIPGILYIPQSGVISVFARRDELVGSGALAGRRLVALHSADGGASNLPTGVYFVDATGPWR